MHAKEAEKEGEKGSVKEQLKDKKVKCRICQGEHFTARCPFKDTMAPVDEPTAGGAGLDDIDEPAGGGMTAGGSYVPPHLRKGTAAAAAAASGAGGSGKYERDDLATLRVTNVSFWLSSIILILKLITSFSRSPSWPRSRNSAIYSSDSVALPEFSLRAIETHRGQRDLPLSVLRTEVMQLALVRRWMDVSLDFFTRNNVVYRIY